MESETDNIKQKYREWFQSTRERSQQTIEQTETIFEGLILKIATGAMAISFSFITALSPKIEYRFLWILAIGWIALALCIIWNILSHLKAKQNCQENIQDIDNYLWTRWKSDCEEDIYKETQKRSSDINIKNQQLDNCYNKPTAKLLILGIVLILAFVFVNIIPNKSRHKLLREETTIHTISSIETVSNDIMVIQQDTLSRHLTKQQAGIYGQ